MHRSNFPVPTVGDIYCRDFLGVYEEALILWVGRDSEASNRMRGGWRVAMFTDRGPLIVTHDGFHTARDAWHPRGWKWDEEKSEFVPPVVVRPANEYIGDVLGDSAGEDADEGGGLPAKVLAWAREHDVSLLDLPTPESGERFQTWAARLRRAVPAAKGHKEVVRLLWDYFKHLDELMLKVNAEAVEADEAGGEE